MPARLLAFWDDLRSSYWFVPTLMTIGSVVLAVVLVEVDRKVGGEWLRDFRWLYVNKPDSARGLLTTIAGSMIGVAGVTFSITIASVVYASGQYGPRLLSNFMRDRGNQFTLGTFIATFVYCLLVLRNVRSAEEASGSEEAAELIGAFVPHLSLLTAFAFAVASVGVLIYFIHHTPESIHVSNVIRDIGHTLNHKIDTLFPERIGQGASNVPSSERDDLPDGFFDEAVRIRSNGDGYVQSVASNRLLELAQENDLLIRLRYRPGDFVTEGDALLLAWPPDGVDDDLHESFRYAFAWGSLRTALQDVRFPVDELVEIAARALSPGINDPFTAMSCLDRLGSALKRLADRDIPSEDRYDDRGSLRVIAEPTSFEILLDRAFSQLRPYVSADRNAALYAMKTLGSIAGRTEGSDRRKAVRDQVEGLMTSAQDGLGQEDAQSVRARGDVVLRVLDGESYEELSAQSSWLGGSA